MKKAVLTVLISGIILSLLLLYNYRNREVKEKIIHDKIQKIEEIATAIQFYREIIYSQETQDLLWIPIGNKEFLISIDYKVLAGINLARGYMVEHKSDHTIITLPRGEILSIDALDESIEEIFIKERFLTISREDYFEPINQSKKRILQGENIPDLLIQCENNAERVLTDLLKVSGIDVKVVFSNSIEREEK